MRRCTTPQSPPFGCLTIAGQGFWTQLKLLPLLIASEFCLECACQLSWLTGQLLPARVALPPLDSHREPALLISYGGGVSMFTGTCIVSTANLLITETATAFIYTYAISFLRHPVGPRERRGTSPYPPPRTRRRRSATALGGPHGSHLPIVAASSPSRM